MPLIDQRQVREATSSRRVVVVEHPFRIMVSSVFLVRLHPGTGDRLPMTWFDPPRVRDRRLGVTPYESQERKKVATHCRSARTCWSTLGADGPPASTRRSWGLTRSGGIGAKSGTGAGRWRARARCIGWSGIGVRVQVSVRRIQVALASACPEHLPVRASRGSPALARIKLAAFVPSFTKHPARPSRAQKRRAVMLRLFSPLTTRIRGIAQDWPPGLPTIESARGLPPGGS